MSERAVSEVVSYALVFGLVVSAVAVVSVSGVSTLQDTRDNEQMANAERAFSVLHDNLADVHRRDAPSRATELSLGEAQLETGPNVTMAVSVTDTSGTTWQSPDWQLRPIVYEGIEDRQLVYEAGAVFRTTNGGGLRVQDPPLVVSEDRVLVSVVGLTRPGAQSVGGGTVVVRGRNKGTNIAYESTANDVDRVTVSLSGTAQPALWQTYFEERDFDCTVTGSDITCTYDPSGSISQVYVVYHDIAVEIES